MKAPDKVRDEYARRIELAEKHLQAQRNELTARMVVDPGYINGALLVRMS